MAEDTRPPVAIRTMRPYATEEAFLEEERDTFSRTAVTLIGAPTRPRGVVIRFEVTLSNGTPVLRGEGRVLGFQPADQNGPSSLTLRFTRLDARSKALVDRAAELRERPSSLPPAVPSPAIPFPDSGPTLTTPGTLPPPGESSPTLTPSNPPPSAEREAKLDRLRDRAKTLSPSQVAAILTPRPSRASKV